jgi:hypothetical protein
MAQPQFLSYDGLDTAVGSQTYAVQAGAVGSIASGIPVSKALGAAYVTAMATNKPVVATDFLAGISCSLSTDTVAADGTVQVQRIFDNDTTWLVAPNNAALWDTQAEYDALVGDRVLLDLTGTTYTVLATDGATNGCVVMPLDITKYPGKVRIAFRKGCNYLS